MSACPRRHRRYPRRRWPSRQPPVAVQGQFAQTQAQAPAPAPVPIRSRHGARRAAHAPDRRRRTEPRLRAEPGRADRAADAHPRDQQGHRDQAARPGRHRVRGRTRHRRCPGAVADDGLCLRQEARRHRALCRRRPGSRAAQHHRQRHLAGQPHEGRARRAASGQRHQLRQPGRDDRDDRHGPLGGRSPRMRAGWRCSTSTAMPPKSSATSGSTRPTQVQLRVKVAEVTPRRAEARRHQLAEHQQFRAVRCQSSALASARVRPSEP